MHFVQNPRLFTEDEPFLVATYEAGRHCKNQNLIVNEKATIEKGLGAQDLGGASKGSGKGTKKEDYQPAGQPVRAGQTEKSGKVKIWIGLREALKGIL
jgi:hypothetical protein